VGFGFGFAERIFWVYIMMAGVFCFFCFGNVGYVGSV